MFDCPSREQLAKLVRRQLDNAEFRRMEEHLKSCAHCREELDAVLKQQAQDFFPALVPPPPTTPLNQNVPGTGVGDLHPHDRVGDFTIVEKIGQGGMGQVYVTTHAYLEGLFALKVIRPDKLSPELHDRFLHEVRLASRLRQLEGIVTVHTAGQFAGTVYYAMEYIDGPNLMTLLSQSGEPMQGGQAATFIERVARNLACVHNLGIVHRDIKPVNILVNRAGEPLLTDFGVACTFGVNPTPEGSGGETPCGDALTVTGEVAGTPGFIAPECFDPPHPVSPASDVYSLGVSLYLLLTGEMPFNPRPGATRRDSPRQGPRMPLRRRKVPEALENICLKCLAQDPALRYRSAAALADDLRQFRTSNPDYSSRH
jgi:serine/threonine-protein kinase